MRPHAPDALSLGVGLVVVLVGAAGLAGLLDIRALSRDWLLPALVVAGGLSVVVSALTRR
jgi:hypothetical protein